MEPIICSRCGDTLQELGGLAYSPPWKPMNPITHPIDAPIVVAKYHICKDCWEKVFKPLFVGVTKVDPTIDFPPRSSMESLGEVVGVKETEQGLEVEMTKPKNVWGSK